MEPKAVQDYSETSETFFFPGPDTPQQIKEKLFKALGEDFGSRYYELGRLARRYKETKELRAKVKDAFVTEDTRTNETIYTLEGELYEKEIKIHEELLEKVRESILGYLTNEIMKELGV